jgi:hypothetical protein
VARIFVSYRRADDPFGAGLIAAALRDRFGADAVFLDTWALNVRGDPESGLRRGLDDSAVVLALIGRRWEERLRSLDPATTRDWVTWELHEAVRRELPVIPVFLRRSPPLLAEGVADDLRNTLPREAALAVRQGSLRSDVEHLVDAIVARGGLPTPRAATVPLGDGLDPGTVATGVDAMLRHVVPVPQQRMGNRNLLVGTAVAVLDPADWLRHVSAGASPGRPAGSGVVVVSETAVTVADLDESFTVVDRRCVTLGRGSHDLQCVEVRRRKRLLVRAVADLRLHRHDGTHLDVRGLFADAARDLLDNLPPAVAVQDDGQPGSTIR